MKQAADQRGSEGEAIAVMRAAGLEPLDPYRSVNTRWRSHCVRCDRVVRPLLHNVKAGHDGCLHCGARFTAAEPAVVYLMSHKQMGAVKVGIMGLLSRRIERHRKFGWQIEAAEQVPGNMALEIELRILGWWRGELCLPPYLSPQQVPQGGWTETVDASKIDLTEAVALVRLHAQAAAI